MAPPAGWSREQGYGDPYANEATLFEISSSNVDSYADKLSAGLVAALKRYPELKIRVFPSHRSAGYPETVMKAVAAGKGAASLDDFSPKLGQGKYVPFPAPSNGLQAIWNHLMRYQGGGSEVTTHTFSVRANGSITKFGFHALRVYDENFDLPAENRLYWFLGGFVSPADMVGSYYLIHEPVDYKSGSRKAWVYNAGQRRVRRAPDLGYDNSQDGTDGLAVIDQYDGYNGSPDRYEWTLLGKKEVLVPYNCYAAGLKSLSYSKMLGKHSMDSSLIRFEIHRVWIVEAKLKQGNSHIYARRTFYLDEDSWSVVLDDAYDAKGQLWRTGLHCLVQYYDVPVPGYAFELWMDLHNGSYVVTGLSNELKHTIRFGVKGKEADFLPDGLRRLGTR